MIRGTDYDLNRYSHRQFWRLVRDLSAFGWRVEIIIAPDRRRPDRPLSPNHCLVRVSNDGYGTGADRRAAGGERYGDTPWSALSRVVEDIVNPLEAGAVKGGCK
jgi:hypothetical protein